MKEIGILLTGHPGHRIFMKETFKYWEQVVKEFPVVVGWDDTSFKWHHPFPANFELILTGEKLGLHPGEYWQMRKGIELLINRGCKYIFKGAVDFMVKDIEKIPSLIECIGENGYLTTPTQSPDVLTSTHIFFVRADTINSALNIKENLETNEWCEARVKRGLDRFNSNVIDQQFSWWQEKIFFIDLQMAFVKKTKLYYEKVWKEGSKDYDITEIDIFKREVPRSKQIEYL